MVLPKNMIIRPLREEKFLNLAFDPVRLGIVGFSSLVLVSPVCLLFAQSFSIGQLLITKA